jgi:hypothetical protein
MDAEHRDPVLMICLEASKRLSSPVVNMAGCLWTHRGDHINSDVPALEVVVKRIAVFHCLLMRAAS